MLLYNRNRYAIFSPRPHSIVRQLFQAAVGAAVLILLLVTAYPQFKSTYDSLFLHLSSNDTAARHLLALTSHPHVAGSEANAAAADYVLETLSSASIPTHMVREDVRELLPEGFEKAVEAEGKAMLVNWSPQEKVLASKAVGCFVTHCGWNSTLEAIAAGIPVVAYPQWGDQVTDAKFLCDVYGIGVRLSAPATREGLEQCVAAAIDGEEAERMRNKAAKWREMARKAITVNGSSDQNIEMFVDDVRKLLISAGRSSGD